MGGAPVTQLAIEGSEGLLVLEDLSRDVHFRGLLVFDVLPWNVFNDMTRHDDTSRAYVSYHSGEPWIARIEAGQRRMVQSTFVFNQVTSERLIQVCAQRGGRTSSAYMLDPDRGCRIDWSRVSAAQLHKPMEYLMPPGSCASPEQLRDNLKTLDAMVRRIESRGGRVALVCLPSTGAVGEAERIACPRDQYWDVLAATTSAVTLNWMDDPRLRKFRCPDGSHLDMHDQVEFTRIVVEDLRAKLQLRYPRHM